MELAPETVDQTAASFTYPVFLSAVSILDVEDVETRMTEVDDVIAKLKWNSRGRLLTIERSKGSTVTMLIGRLYMTIEDKSREAAKTIGTWLGRPTLRYESRNEPGTAAGSGRLNPEGLG